MANLNVYYQIFETNSKQNSKEDIQEYFLELKGLNDFKEDSYELTREKVEEFMESDGLERKFISKSKIEFKLMKRGEKDQNNFSELAEPYLSLKSNCDYDLYLNIIIDGDSYTKEMEKEDENEKKREKDMNRVLNSKASQITKELAEIQKQLKDIKQAPIEDENASSEIYYKSIIKRKNSFHEKRKSKINEVENIVNQQNKSNTLFLPQINMSINQNTQERKETNFIKKIYFLYSNPLQITEKSGKEKKGNNEVQTDYSCYKQWLSIYKLFKNYKNIEPYFKQIENTLYLEQNPYILHIRVDSILKDEKLYFIFSSKNGYYIEYDIENCITKFNSNHYPNLKLFIISSNNIEKIKELFQKYKNLKNVNKIYIEHPNKDDKENKYQRENMENKFIEDFYSNLLKNELLIDAYNKSIKESNIKKYISEDIWQKKIKFFIGCEKKSNDEENIINQKYILNYNLIADNYYPSIGRKKEFFQSLVKNSDKIIIYGIQDIDKNCFLKNLGFSFLEKLIVDIVYFLEIYPYEINKSKKLYKIDMIIDEIYKTYDEGKILLIIYFNSVINEENFIEIKNEIKRQRISKNKNVSIRYIYAFDIKPNSEIQTKINEFPDNVKLENFINFDIDEIKNFINFYTKNKNNELEIINKLYEEMIKIKKGKRLKIDNIYLLLVYLNLNLKDKKIISELIDIKNENFLKLAKIISEDDYNSKEKIIGIIIDKNKEIKNIFIYLYILRFGIGLSFLKLIWKGSWEQKINYIKNNLIGLIIIEKNEKEEIYRLNNSFRGIIGKYLKLDINNNKYKEILKYYYFIFRKLVNQLKYDKIFSFNACIDNKFWFTRKAKLENLNEEYIFNEEIDSNNIYDIIKNTKNYDELLPYLDDISITLPTILNSKNNLIYEDLIVKIFEENFEERLKNKSREYRLENQSESEIITYLKTLIIRLGIFKCRTTKKNEFLKKSLEKANAETKNKYKELNCKTKIELSLIKIYLEIIRGGKNIEAAKEEFQKNIKEINDENDKKNFQIRYKALYIKCLNSFKLFIDFEKNLEVNQKENYKKELNNLKYQITMYCARFKFYFFLQNPIMENSNEIIEINNNFFLTQKLLTILPKNFGIEFKSFKKEDNNSPFLDIKNILFLYIDNKNLFDNSIGKNKSEKNIKILILGYSVDNEQNIVELHNRGIKNIIYISSNELKSKQMCFFKILFFNFIHIFISILVSKENNISIMKAFKEAKGNFNKNFKYIMEVIGTDLIIPKIDIKMYNESDIFDVDYIEHENEETTNNQNIKYINDEYEYEDEMRLANLYYKRNVFSETKEKKEEFREKTNKKHIKMPGNQSLNEDNFKEFISGEIYHISKFKELITKIENSGKENNIFNVYSSNNKKIASDICKYFYMEKKYENGIYKVSMISNEFEKLCLSNSDENDSKNSKDLKYLKLVVLDKINNPDIILNEELIEKMKLIKKTHFIICSSQKENDKFDSHFFNDEIENKSIIGEIYNDGNIDDFCIKYNITQSIINNINME